MVRSIPRPSTPSRGIQNRSIMNCARGAFGSWSSNPRTPRRRSDANFLEPDAKLDAYRDVRAAVNKRVKEVMETAAEPDVVAETVLKAARAAHPEVRYTAGSLAGRLRLLRRFAPAGVLDAGIRRDLRLEA
jgi:hypothetical protein